MGKNSGRPSSHRLPRRPGCTPSGAPATEAGFLLGRCDGCEAVLLGIEQQVLRANQYKESHTRTQQQVEAEVSRQGCGPLSKGACLSSLFLFSRVLV